MQGVAIASLSVLLLTQADARQRASSAADLPPAPLALVTTFADGRVLEGHYGQTRPGDRGVTVEVGPGERVQGIDIVLARGGVFTGRITDELGEPYPGVQVQALVVQYRLGKRVPTVAGIATTDDLGQFRIAALRPGSYYLVATSTELWRNEKKVTLGYSSTYFPGGPIEAAQAVTLADRTGIP